MDDATPPSISVVQYAIEHMFMPIHLPQKEDDQLAEKDHFLACFAAKAAEEYCSQERIDTPFLGMWTTIRKMLHALSRSHASEILSQEEMAREFASMKIGGKHGYRHIDPLFVLTLNYRCFDVSHTQAKRRYRHPKGRKAHNIRVF